MVQNVKQINLQHAYLSRICLEDGVNYEPRLFLNQVKSVLICRYYLNVDVLYKSLQWSFSPKDTVCILLTERLSFLIKT